MGEKNSDGFEQWDSTTINHDLAHARPENLDPKTNGPFLDDDRAEQEAAYRAGRAKHLKEVDKKIRAAEKKAEEKKGK
jgi:hypothetical protein